MSAEGHVHVEFVSRGALNEIGSNADCLPKSWGSVQCFVIEAAHVCSVCLPEMLVGVQPAAV